MQQNIGSQTTNSSARAIVPREVLCLNTFDALTNNIVHVPSESLQLFGEINGMIEVLRKVRSKFLKLTLNINWLFPIRCNKV